MEIVNVITVVDGVVSECKSFPVPYESYRDSVAEEAEKYFKNLIEESGSNNIEEDLENGCYVTDKFSVSITWSE